MAGPCSVRTEDNAHVESMLSIKRQDPEPGPTPEAVDVGVWEASPMPPSSMASSVW